MAQNAARQEKHIHKLKRIKYKTGNSVFFCALDCNYKVSTTLALGKKTICWRCGETFAMNEYCLRLAKPHCESCHKPKSKDKHLMEGQLPDKVGEIMELNKSASLVDRLNAILQKTQATNEEEDI